MTNRGELKAIIARYGRDQQEDVAIEEMSELIKAILKMRRNGVSLENFAAVVDELADVMIMLDQLLMIYCCEEAVESRRAYKIRRQMNRMEEETNGER